MNVLVVAPHPDDEVIGCGGTIAKHSSGGDAVYVCIVTKGCEPLFSDKLVSRVRAECREADALLGVKETVFLDFPAAMLEEVPRYKLNDALAETVQRIRPDVVYIPHRGDMQLDHKMIVDAVMVALRPKSAHRVARIYSYETMSETGWDLPNVTNEFIPNSYNDITEHLDLKLRAMSLFTTQVMAYPNARSVDALKALAMYRGSMVSMHAAEAFVLIRELRGDQDPRR